MGGRRRDGGLAPGEYRPLGPAIPRKPPTPAIESPPWRWNPAPKPPTRHVPITEEKPRGEVVEIIRMPPRVQNLKASRLAIAREQAGVVEMLSERAARGLDVRVEQLDVELEGGCAFCACLFPPR